MLTNLLASLNERDSSETVFNPYRDLNILNNLEAYFKYLLRNNADVLLVGEAPGYKGCRLTGIPFTSGAVIKEAHHNVFQDIGKFIKLRQVTSEITAKILWDCLNQNKPVPILWNAFPFHPHHPGKPESNRPPTISELEEGKQYLEIVYSLFKPERIGSIGKAGMKILSQLFPNRKIIHIRHPSYGGKADFLKEMRKILMSENSFNL